MIASTDTKAAYENLVKNFARLWQTKDISIVREIVAHDAVAHWAGTGTFSGAEYPERARVVMHELLPDVVTEVTGHATDGKHVFISWHSRATIAGQPIEWDGINRFRLRGDLADEVVAIYDTAPLTRVFQEAQPYLEAEIDRRNPQ